MVVVPCVLLVVVFGLLLVVDCGLFFVVCCYVFLFACLFLCVRLGRCRVLCVVLCLEFLVCV